MLPTPSRFLLWLPFALSVASCSIFHRADRGPVVETVRTEDSPTPPTAARDLADVMTTTLNLKPEQTTKVRAILNNTVSEVNAARQKYPPKSAPLTAELKRINASSEGQLRQVLGPAGYQQYQAKKRQIAAQMQQRQK
jgi:hypothetical protein